MNEAIGDYFRQMLEANGWSMAYTLTEEFFGITEDEITQVIEELGIEDN